MICDFVLLFLSVNAGWGTEVTRAVSFFRKLLLSGKTWSVPIYAPVVPINRENKCVSPKVSPSPDPSPAGEGRKRKTGKNPLQRMGLRPAVRLPLWSYKSKLLTPKLKVWQHLLSEGIHPLQGDKQKKIILWAEVHSNCFHLRNGIFMQPHCYREKGHCHGGLLYNHREKVCFFCLSPCAWCKTRQGGCCGRLKIYELARGIFSRPQHPWLVRDIASSARGFSRFLSFLHTQRKGLPQRSITLSLKTFSGQQCSGKVF